METDANGYFRFSQVPLGAFGFAFEKGEEWVVVCFFGDGANNEGAFHESLNLAAVWNLPVVFLCENNQYAVTSSFKDMVATENVSDRAAGYNLPGILVDGRGHLPVSQTRFAGNTACRSRQ